MTAQWRIGPANALIGIEVWGRRERQTALIRLIDDAGSMDAGSVTAGGTDDALVLWTNDARADYGNDWLDKQADIIQRSLVKLWGTT